MRAIVPFLAAIALLLPCLVVAAPLDQGTLELETSVSLDHSSFTHSGSSTGTVTNFDGTVGAAWSLTRIVQLGGGLLFSSSSFSPEGEASISSHAVGGSVDVTANFRAPSGLVPFVRLGIGAMGFGGDGFEGSKSSLLAPMVRAGVRVLVGDAGSANFSVSYRHDTNADGVPDDDANRFGFAVGFSLFPIHGK